jgi:hypothetical protein
MKKFIAIAAILAVVSGFTACQAPALPSKDKVVVTNPPKVSTETPTDNTGGTGKQPQKPEENKTPITPPAADLPSKGSDVSAVYVGQIDGNSIEVKIDGKRVALFFSSSVKASFDTSLFKSGSTVRVTYSKNDKGQLVLTSIKSAMYGIAVSGVYVGQMDNNSLEVKINGKPIAFYLSDKFKQSFKPGEFKTGENVKVYYYKNSKGQIVLTGLGK